MAVSNTRRMGFIVKCGRKALFFIIPFLVILSVTLFYKAHQKSSYKAVVALRVDDPLGIEPTDDKILTAANASPASLVKKRLSVRLDHQAGIMNISLTGSSPRGLVNTANAIADVYIRELSLKAGQVDRNLIKEKYSATKQYKRDLEKDLKEAMVRLEDYEAKVEKFRAEDSKIATILNTLKARLLEMEAERARLLRVYTNLHPDVVRVDSDIAAIKDEMAGAPPRPTGGFELEKELEYRQKKYLELKRKWDDIKSKSIEEIIAPKRTFAVTAYAKRSEPLFDPGTRAMIFIIGLLSSIVSGLAAMLLAAAFDTSILNPDELSTYVHLPVIGALSLISSPQKGKKAKASSGLILRYENQEAVMEPYRLLYTRMPLEASGTGAGDGKSIFITSSLPGEGKSILAANLALVMARAGKKALLLDCNFARPAVHRLFGIDPKRPGLTDILNRGATLDSSLMNITDMALGHMGMAESLKFKGLDRLSLIIAGSPISTASELLRSDKIDLLFSELKTRFDFLILDGPPVATSADSLILAPKCQAVFLVYSAGRNAASRATLRSAIKHLTASQAASLRSGPNIKGVIMTKCT